LHTTGKGVLSKGTDFGWVWRIYAQAPVTSCIAGTSGRSSAIRNLIQNPPLRHPTTYDDCFALSADPNLYNILHVSSSRSITFIARPSYLASSPSLVPHPALRYPSTSKHFRIHVRNLPSLGAESQQITSLTCKGIDFLRRKPFSGIPLVFPGTTPLPHILRMRQTS
jgi:hypothetical protein